MSVLWQKVWFDLWHNRTRTALAALSIAAGVFAVGTIFGMNDQLLSGMDRAQQAVSPSNLNMFLLTAVDRDTLLGLKNVKGVVDVEAYNQVRVRYKLRPDERWQQAVVIMRDNYARQKLDTIELKAGRWPTRRDVAVDRLSSEYFGLHIGDQVIFKVGESERTLPIAGLVRYALAAPPQFGGPAYFFVDREGLERFDVPDGKFSGLLVRVNPDNEDQAKAVASAIKDRLARQGIGVQATLVQDTHKHWGRPFVEGLTLVLEVLAVLSAFTSVILVFNTLTSILTQQTNQIGIIKAVGGTSRVIVRIYLAGVLVYGILALTLSLPAGVVTAFELTRMFLNLFNIDYDVLRVSDHAAVLMILSAIVVPLLAALWPALRGAAVTAREAMASYGIGADFGSSSLDRAVERLGGRLLPSHYAVALGNMFRRKGRLVLTQLVLIMSGGMFLAVMALSASVGLTLDNEFGRRHYDTLLQFDQEQYADRAAGIAEARPGVEKAEIWFTHPATILRLGHRLEEAGLGVDLVGVPAANDVYRPLIVAGRWLAPGDGRVVVLSKDTADKNHLRVGDRLTLDLGELGKYDWTVAGVYQLVFSGGFNVDTIYAPQDAIFHATNHYNRGLTLYVRTRVHDASAVDAVTGQLKDVFEARGAKIYVSRTIYELRREADSEFGIIIMMFMALAIVVAMVGGIGLAGALSIGVVERTREIGVLRGVGAPSRTIMGMFVMEGVLQGVMSWVAAVPLSILVSRPLAAALGQVMLKTSLDYQYNRPAVGIWLALIVLISVLASILPARAATRISVRDSLAYA